MNSKISIIYLLGAGRSGTTLLAAALNAHPQIQSVGEMHQFFEHMVTDKKCSCGQSLANCSFWSDVLEDLDLKTNEMHEESKIAAQMERHKNIPKLWLTKRKESTYLKTQEQIFKSIQKNSDQDFFLDSSKYMARYLLLKKSGDLSLKGIYMVRDVRGVINSFNKQVQTHKKPWATIIYYLAINIFGQLITLFDKNVLKIKYEDFVEDPAMQLQRIYFHIFDNLEKGVTLPKMLEMPHIIGGNRMKIQKQITIKKDYQWKNALHRRKQWIYYLAALPIMLINKYKI